MSWVAPFYTTYFPLKEILLAHFSEEVIVMHSEKMKAKYVKENVWKAGILQLHYKLTSSQIVFRDFKYLFRFIFSNSYLSFLHKILEKHLWNSFLLYLVVEIWNKLLHKRGFLKNFSKFSDKHKEQSSGGVQSKDVLKNFVKFTEKTSLPDSPF